MTSLTGHLQSWACVVFLTTCCCMGLFWMVLAFLLLRWWNQTLLNATYDYIQASFLRTFCFVEELNHNLELELSGDEVPMNENALVLPNHQNHDWGHIFYLASHRGTLAGIRTVLKGSSKFIPFFGWVMWLNNWPLMSMSRDGLSHTHIHAPTINIITHIQPINIHFININSNTCFTSNL